MGLELTRDHQKLAVAVAALVHKEKMREAALLVSDGFKLKLRLVSEDPKKTTPPLQAYLHWLLNNGGMAEAAALLWTPNQFTPKPKFTQDVWDLFDRANTGLMMGAASVTKSYSMGVRLFLEWIRDPAWTTVRVLGPSEEHLEANLFSHLVSLHEGATLPMPGTIGERFIGLNRRNQISSIKGVVVPVGQRKKAGRLQGAKRKPRLEPHPVFGPLSRMFLFLDEVENIPLGIWSDVDNVLANVDEIGTPGLKIFGAYNPTNPSDEVGKRAEPEFGWGEFDPDKHFKWKSKRGWDVVRLDGEQSENVIAGKVIYPGIQTRAGLETIAKNSGGKDSPGYFSMGRGAYPPQGVAMVCIPAGMVAKCRGEFIWYNTPIPLGSNDLALEGGAASVYSLGKLGLATGVKRPPSVQHPTGLTEMFKDKSGTVSPRWALQLDQQFPLPKGDTVKMAGETTSVSKRAGVRPERLCIDRTGPGSGVADLIKYDWSPAIIDVNYSQSASDMKIMEEDTQTCLEAYDRLWTELWFALRAWMEFGYIAIHPSVDGTKLVPQVSNRLYTTRGKKKKIESKQDYKGRGFESPDEGDSFTLLVHAARMSEKLVLSMKGFSSEGGEDDLDSDWYGTVVNGVRIDPSNQMDFLD